MPAHNASPERVRSDPPAIQSSWDDLLEGVATPDQWQERRALLRTRFLELLRDDHKPARPPSELRQEEEEVVVDDCYRRIWLTYAVEEGERARACLGIPLDRKEAGAAVVALHGTTAQGTLQTAGIEGHPDKAYLDQLCRAGFVVLAPEHFVSGSRIPPEGPYQTERFYERHPEWTAVGKFTFEHSIAVDVLQSLPEVDSSRIGVMGHSLGGHGAFFLGAYDERIQAVASNCSGAFFRHNSGVEHWARDHWYVYFKHLRPALLEGRLPSIDFHEIIGLIAPRPFLDLSGLNDGDPACQQQRALMMLKLSDLYALLGHPENFAFFMHGRGHSVPMESRALLTAFLQTHLIRPSPEQGFPGK